MNLVSVMVTLLVVGVFLYIVENVIPMDSTIKRILEAVVLLAVLIYILQALGVLGGHVFS